MRRKFIDKLLVRVRAGRGGNGLPKYAGVGGKGGDVWVCAKEGKTLRELITKFPSRSFSATSGDHSRKFCIQAAAGTDHVINVPVGVEVLAENGSRIGDCDAIGERVLVARGGEGGAPANGYIGQCGQTGSVHLLYKLIADVGLVGFPNAGKSSLLGAISHAKPKIANYPFTTMEPKLGVVRYDDTRQIAVADLPGLIEGASKNIGLGHSFLRHVERTKLLLLVVDAFGFRLKDSDPLRSALETVAILNREIELYKPELLTKPAMLLVNKMDLPGAQRIWRHIQDAFRPLSRGATLRAAIHGDINNNNSSSSNNNNSSGSGSGHSVDDELAVERYGDYGDVDDDVAVALGASHSQMVPPEAAAGAGAAAAGGTSCEWDEEAFQQLCHERLTPLLGQLPEALRPRRWLQFEYVVPFSALATRTGTSAATPAAAAARNTSSSSDHHHQQQQQQRQQPRHCGVPLALLKRHLRDTLDRCTDDRLEQQQQLGCRPDLSTLQQRLESDGYVPLDDHVVEMHRGEHTQRHRRSSSSHQLPTLV